MFVLGRDIVYDRPTAHARDVFYEKRFPKRLRNTQATYVQGWPFLPKFKTQIISTVVQYHSSLETAGKLTKPARDREYPW